MVSVTDKLEQQRRETTMMRHSCIMAALICALSCSNVAAMYHEPSIGSYKCLFIDRAEQELVVLRQNLKGWKLQQRWRCGTVCEQLLDKEIIVSKCPLRETIFDIFRFTDKEKKREYFYAEVEQWETPSIEFKFTYCSPNSNNDNFKYKISSAPKGEYIGLLNFPWRAVYDCDLHNNMFALLLSDGEQLQNQKCIKGSLLIGTILPYCVIKIVKQLSNILDCEDILLRDGIIYLVDKQGRVTQFFVDFPLFMAQKNKTTAGCGFVLEKNSDIFFEFK